MFVVHKRLRFKKTHDKRCT